MIRRCTGEDPNLLMSVNAAGQRIDIHAEAKVVIDAFLALPEHARRRVVAAIGHVDLNTGDKLTDKPCDCGITFDDARRSTIWPHDPI